MIERGIFLLDLREAFGVRCIPPLCLTGNQSDYLLHNSEPGPPTIAVEDTALQTLRDLR